MSDKFFVHDELNGDIDYFETKEEALRHAKNIISDNSDDGFPEEILDGAIKVGLITHCSMKVNERPIPQDEKDQYPPEWSFLCEVEMGELKTITELE